MVIARIFTFLIYKYAQGGERFKNEKEIKSGEENFKIMNLLRKHKAQM